MGVRLSAPKLCDRTSGDGSDGDAPGDDTSTASPPAAAGAGTSSAASASASERSDVLRRMLSPTALAGSSIGDARAGGGGGGASARGLGSADTGSDDRDGAALAGVSDGVLCRASHAAAAEAEEVCPERSNVISSAALTDRAATMSSMT